MLKVSNNPLLEQSSIIREIEKITPAGSHGSNT
jgi:hypothetical protein